MKKIMLVDDDPTMLMLLETLLKMEGYQVSQSNGDEGVYQELLSRQPDILLMDVNLRGENGLELTATIRSQSEMENMTVILSSGIDYRQEAEQVGANAFLLKPYMPDDLIRILKQQVEQER